MMLQMSWLEHRINESILGVIDERGEMLKTIELDGLHIKARK